MGISNEGQEQSDKFQFIEQFPAVILRNEETKNDSGELFDKWEFGVLVVSRK